EVRPLGRTPFALFVTDEDAQADRTEGGVGSDRLALTRLDGGGEQITLDLGDVGRILHAIPSPDGSKIAVSTHDDVVRLVTLRGLTDPATTSASGAGASASGPGGASPWEQDADAAPGTPHLDGVREIGRSGAGEISELAWSPDSRWLVWSEPNALMLGRLMISDTEDAEPMGRALTSGRYQDGSPAFSADGKHLALLSLRTFETTYDDMVFDLGFVNAERPFLIPLEATTADPFGPEPDGWGSTEEGTSPGSGGTSGASGASGASEASAAADAADPAGASDAS